MAILDIPVNSDQPMLELTLELDRRFFTLRIRWNERMGRWLMDIARLDGTNILAGIPLLTNTNLVGRFQSDDLPAGDFLVFDESGEGKTPGRNDLGGQRGTCRLLYREALA